MLGMQQGASFELDRFEQVRAGGDRTLLRVAGRWTSPEPARLEPPELLIGAERFATLPSPDDPAPAAGPEGAAWRAAFLAPEAIVAGADASFALVVGEDVCVALPRPAERRIPSPDAAASPGSGAPSLTVSVSTAAVRDECRRRIAAERIAASRQDALQKIGERLRAANAARVDAEQQLHEAQARIADLERQVGELSAAAVERDEARELLARREDELRALVARLEDAEREADVAQATVDALEHGLAHAEIARTEAEARADQLQASGGEADELRTCASGRASGRRASRGRATAAASASRRWWRPSSPRPRPHSRRPRRRSPARPAGRATRAPRPCPSAAPPRSARGHARTGAGKPKPRSR
jgi:hypothetical protein